MEVRVLRQDVGGALAREAVRGKPQQGGRMSDCDRDRCFCHGVGHFCDLPDEYPQEAGQQWTCAECGKSYETQELDGEHATRLLASIGMKPPHIGWRLK